MKKLKVALLAIVAVVSFSCSDDNSNGGNDDTYIKFKVNGEQFNIIEPQTLTSGAAVIMAVNIEGQYMMLRMPADATVGTHALSESNSVDPTTYQAAASIDGDNIIDATAGTLEITSIGTEYMKGTFSFTGTGDVNGTAYTITDGEFRAYKPANE